LKSEIQSLEVSYLLHATEDPQKVKSAVVDLVSAEVDPEAREAEGHFGNKIVRVRFHLIGEDATKAFVRILDRLSSQTKEELGEKLGAHIDEHSALFLRFDKQRLVAGSLALSSADPVRVKVKPRIFLIQEDALSFYSRLLGVGN
jgi:RNA binding exosome subunit